MTYALVLYYLLADGVHAEVIARGLALHECMLDAEMLAARRALFSGERLVCEGEA